MPCKIYGHRHFELNGNHDGKVLEFAAGMRAMFRSEEVESWVSTSTSVQDLRTSERVRGTSLAELSSQVCSDSVRYCLFIECFTKIAEENGDLEGSEMLRLCGNTACHVEESDSFANRPRLESGMRVLRHAGMSCLPTPEMV